MNATRWHRQAFLCRSLVCVHDNLGWRGLLSLEACVAVNGCSALFPAVPGAMPLTVTRRLTCWLFGVATSKKVCVLWAPGPLTSRLLALSAAWRPFINSTGPVPFWSTYPHSTNPRCYCSHSFELCSVHSLSFIDSTFITQHQQ
jgi:hypothetical protein